MKRFGLTGFFSSTSLPKGGRISVLINAYYFSLMHVLVIERDKDFHLVIIDQKVQMVEDKHFDQLEEAQDYFDINYTLMVSAASSGEIAEWTPLYMPKKRWLNKLLRSCFNVKDQVSRVPVIQWKKANCTW
jgi:hypothetical protein